MRRLFRKRNDLYDRLSELLADIKPPTLILDALWQEQFKNHKSTKIISLERKITDLMKEHARYRETEEDLIRKKKECLRHIINLSQDAHNKNSLEAKEAISEFQKAVLDINNELEQIEKKSDKLPPQLDKANREMMLETVFGIYFNLRKSRARSQALIPIIEKIRLELRQATAEKADCEEEAARTYQLLHNMIGSELLNLLDGVLSGFNKERREV
ncbi:MAG: hypothetical protein LBQ68_02770 [Clostridiales bacterium]|nr:hypothetical protein [Clostridiales bacterium]